MSKFNLGRTVATAGVAAKQEQDPSFDKFVSSSYRHLSCDWGEVCEEDKQANNDALRLGNRILSVYSHQETKIYIITEADRSITTVLFPEEY